MAAMRSVQEHHSEISPQKFGLDKMDKICLNVGGQKHETYLSTVGHLPDTRLYWILESAVKSPDYDPETTEVFFDRHPAVFAQILNYYRTGKLHCPTDVCGPLFEQELNYWGIDEKDMEPCCWGNYTQHRDAEENLKNVLYEGTSDDPIVDSSTTGQPSERMRVWRQIQPQVWAILDESRSSNKAKVFSFVSVMFIIISVAMFCINTIPELKNDSKWVRFFTVVETICGAWFTLEFLLRTVFCPNKRAFARNWTTWIDFLAVMPFYLKLMIRGHENAFDALLVIRLLRLFRFFRLIYGLQVLTHTLKASSYELVLLLFMLLIPVIFFSSIVFFIEDHLDGDNTKFRSIPHSFWWSLITITTVGYGDMYPVTWIGKVVGSMCAICGVLIVALPVSIIGSNFTLFYTHAQARLKLPKKKNKIFLQQTSAVYSERQLPRRRAIRRKISSRASDSYSVTNEENQVFCQDATLFCKGLSSSRSIASRDSNLANNESRLRSPSANGRKIPRKKASTISVKIPMQDLNREVHNNDDKEGKYESRPQKGCSSFDSVHYITTRKTKSPALDSCNANDSDAEDVEGDTTERLFDKDKRNIRFSGPNNNTAELVPLVSLARNCSNEVPIDEINNRQNLAETMIPAGYQQLSADKQNALEPQDSDNSDTEQSILNNADLTREDTSPSGRIQPLRKNAAVNWTRRPSGLPSIIETTLNITPNAKAESPSDDACEKDSTCLGVPADKIHFNRARRQSAL